MLLLVWLKCKKTAEERQWSKFIDQNHIYCLDESQWLRQPNKFPVVNFIIKIKKILQHDNENIPGWADWVGKPNGDSFCKKEKATQQKYNKQQKQKIKIFRSIEKTVRFSKSHLKKHA